MRLKAIASTILISSFLTTSAVAVKMSLATFAQISPGLTEAEVQKIAGDITVRIDEKNRGGSGVIVEKKGDTYYVLTNWHVVNQPGDYQIVTADGKQHPVYYSLIRPLPDLDLAIAPFNSSENYPVARLGNSEEIVEGKTVYVAGWPRSGGSLQQRIFISSQGVVTGRQESRNGYTLLYDNLVRAGMSGGPVLADSGRLVAINGIVKLEENSDKIVSGGIEINAFLNWRQTVSLPVVPRPSETAVNNSASGIRPGSNSPVNPSRDFVLARAIAETSGTIASLSISTPYVVSGNSNGNISVSNLSSGEAIATIQGHDEAINSIAVNPGGDLLVSGSDDKTIKIWKLSAEIESKEVVLQQTLTGHSDAVSAVAISADGEILASGSWDKTIKIWNLTTGELLKTLTGHSRLISALAISRDGQFIASGSKDSTIKLWNLQTGELVKTLSGHSLSVLSVAISADGNVLASSSAAGIINLWNWQTGELIRSLSGHLDGIWSVAIAEDGNTLVSGSWDKTVKIWDLSSGDLKASLSGHSGYVNSVAISRDAQIIVSGGWDGKINIWRRPQSTNKDPR